MRVLLLQSGDAFLQHMCWAMSSSKGNDAWLLPMQIDWDYHMRLQSRGTPGMDPANGSIIHFYHFRYWRLHGIAHELRDSAYTHPNCSLLSTAYGRTKEFKDRWAEGN